MVIALVSAHVAAPHRYRRYFPAEWLSFVRDEHVQCSLEGTSDRAVSLSAHLKEIALVESFRHPSLDVAAHVIGDPGTVERQGLQLLSLAPGDAAEAVNENVVIYGHCLEGLAGTESEVVKPMSLQGRVSTVDGESRGFVDTSGTETVMGMCGGPILNDQRQVIGLLEGLVPKESAMSALHEKVAGHSAYVTSISLRLFVREVEQLWQESRKS